MAEGAGVDPGGVCVLQERTVFAGLPLRDQIRRAAISIMSNIAEGFERDGRSEFIQFLSIAKGSAGEVESQLYVALDQDYIAKKEFDDLKSLAGSAKRLIAGFMNYLKRTTVRGQKYKR